MAESDPPKHPLADVALEKCHELLMGERNLLITAKADRENELVRTLIQISSAALLLIPVAISSENVKIPKFGEAYLLYFGLFFLALSLLTAIAEQHLSSIAYQKQIDVVFRYYTKVSAEDQHERSVLAVKWTRTSALALFTAGIIFAAFGLATIL